MMLSSVLSLFRGANANSYPERRISDTSLPSHEEEGAIGPSPNEMTEPEQTPVTEEAPLDEFLRLEKSSKSEEDRPASTMSADTGYHGETADTSMGGRATVSSPTAMDHSTEEKTMTAASTPSVEQTPELTPSDSRKRKNNGRTYKLEKLPFAPETQWPSNSSPKPKRRLLVQCDKPNLKSPAAVAVKAKTPRKSQAITEKLLSSIEAKKSRPTKEEAKAIEELKMEHETRLRAVQKEHNAQIHALQNNLKNASEEEQRLLADVRSLQDVLDMKQTEVRDLRQLNDQLKLKVASIPEKDMDIQKLRQRVEQLHETVALKAANEKALTSKMDELQKNRCKQLTPARMSDHRNQTQFYTPRDNSIRPGGVHSSFPESERSPMRNGHAASSPSTVDQPDVMTRSALSCVREQGRKHLSHQTPSQRTGTKIYAPEGIWDAERDSGVVAARRGLSFQSNSTDPGSHRSANEDVSVRQASEKAVLDEFHSVPDVDL